MIRRPFMRQPTPLAQLFAWWREACTNPDIKRSDGFPECVYYKRRLIKGGPWVCARIWCDREINADFELTGPERLRCEVDGQYRDANEQWTYLMPITRQEYDAILQRHMIAPEMQTPEIAIDLTRKPLWTP